MRSLRPALLLCCLAALGCASTVDGTAATGPIAWTDVPPGLNPDGLDPFHPVEAGVIGADATAPDAGDFTFADATVFDQRYGTLYVGANGPDTTYVSASFRYVPYPDDPRCEQRAAGSWDFYTCTTDGSAPVDPHPRSFPNAGVIDVRSGAESVALTTQADGEYRPYYTDGTLFPGLATVRLRAPGTAAVPAFDLSFTMPPDVDVLSPVPGLSVVVDHTRDLVITWTPSAAREVWVVLYVVESLPDSSRTYRASVQAYGDVGRAVLPARALTGLPVGDAVTATLSVLPYNITTARVGAWPITATVVGSGPRFDASIR